MPPQKKFLMAGSRPEPLRALENLLSKENGVAMRADSEKKVLAEIERSFPDGIFLDAEDPKCGALCLRLRKKLPPTACVVVFFGPKIPASETARFLDQGADDYWSHPFNETVCLAYLRAMLRRLSPLPSQAKVLELDGLRIDPARREATLRGKLLRLRSKEFDLLYFFLQHRGQALGRDVLMAQVWGQEYFGTTRTVDFHIVQLRQKLGPRGKSIETVPGVGYRFSAGV